jgi:hypothetical protein
MRSPSSASSAATWRYIHEDPMKTLLLIITLAISAFGQTTNSGLNKKFDKFKDQTLISTSFLKLYPANSFSNDNLQIVMTANVSFSGETLTADSELFHLHFITRSPSWRFLHSHDLTLLADGKRIAGGTGIRRGDINSGPGVSVSESLIYTLTRKDFQTIVDAKSVELQIGNFESKFSTADLLHLQLIMFAGTKSP